MAEEPRAAEEPHVWLWYRRNTSTEHLFERGTGTVEALTPLEAVRAVVELGDGPPSAHTIPRVEHGEVVQVAVADGNDPWGSAPTRLSAFRVTRDRVDIEPSDVGR